MPHRSFILLTLLMVTTVVPAAQIIDPSNPRPDPILDPDAEQALSRQEMVWQQLVLVDELTARQNWRDAADLLQTLLSRSPEDPLLLRKGAHLFVLVEKWDLARSCLEQLIEQGVEEPSIDLRLTLALLMLDRVDDAAAWFGSREPGLRHLPETWVIRSILRYRQNRPHGLERIVDQASLDEVARMAFWLQEYRRLLPRGISTRGFISIAGAVVDTPTSVLGGGTGASQRLGEDLTTYYRSVRELQRNLGQRNPAAARAAYSSLRSVARETPTLLAYGHLVDHLNNVTGARSSLAALAESHPRNMRIRLLYGHLCMEDGDFDTAFRVFEALRMERPELAEAEYFALLALGQQGRTYEMVERLLRMLRDSPETVGQFFRQHTGFDRPIKNHPDYAQWLQRAEPERVQPDADTPASDVLESVGND